MSIYPLTTSADNKTGTSGNDTFDGSVANTFQAFDSLDGGAGTDTLIANMTAGSVTTTTNTLQNIENIQVWNAAAGSTLNLTNTTGVTTVGVNAAAGNFTVSGLSSSVTNLSIQGFGTANVADTYTFQYTNTALSGTADAVTLTLDGVGDNALAGRDTVIISPTTGTEGVEALTLDATGSAGSFITLGTAGATDLATINSTGTAALNLDLATNDVVNFTNLTTFDASTATGAQTVLFGNGTNAITVTGGSGNDSFSLNAGAGSINAGAGNDTITLNATVNAAEVIDGGAGTDTLVGSTFANLVAAFSAGNVSNIEAVKVTNAVTANATLDLSKTGSVNSITFGGNVTAIATVDNFTASPTVSLQGTANTGTVIANLKDASGTSDAITVNLGTSTTAGAAGGTLTMANIESATINSLGTGTGTNTLTITPSAALESVTVKGAEAFNLTFTGGTASLQTYDASTATGSQNTTGVTFASTQTTITGGSAADTLFGGTGRDLITGNAGNDVLFGGVDTAADTLSGGSGSDTYMMYNNGNAANATNAVVDVYQNFTLGAGGDTLSAATLTGAPTQHGTASIATLTSLTATLPTATTDPDGEEAEILVLDSSSITAANAQEVLTKAWGLNYSTSAVYAGSSIIIAYSSSSTGSVRLATATLNATGQITAIKDFAVLDGITTSEFSSGFYQSNLTDLPSVGKAYSLTISPTDSIVGTSGDDTITGTGSGFLVSTDTVDGAGGTNILTIVDTATATTDANFANIQTINWSETAGGTVDFTGQTEALAMNLTFAAVGSTVKGGNGNDTITLNTAGTFTTTSDVIDGGLGTNTLNVASGNLVATADADLVHINTIATTASGLTVTLTGQTESFIMNGFAGGASALTGSVAADSITGGSGADSLTGGGGNDTLIGGDGNDTLVGNAGNDYIMGGADNDQVVFATTGWLGAADTIDGGTGTNTLSITGAATATNDSNLTNIQNVIWTEGAGGTVDFTGQTEALAMNLTFAAVGSTVKGGNGNDTITLNTAGTFSTTTDVIDGGLGTNTLNVASGNLVATADADLVNINTIATTATGLTVTLTGQAEAFIMNGITTGASTLTGGSGADSITGGSGTDSLSGGIGNDTIFGGAGNDTITGGAGVDVMHLGTNTTSDAVVISTPASDTGIASGFAASSLVPVQDQTINISGCDIVYDMSAGDTITTTGLTTSGAALIRNGGTTGAATVGDGILLTGNYDSTSGTFTVTTAGTSSLFVYDDNGTAVGGSYRAIVLANYTDTGAADTWSAAGVFTSVA